MANNKDGRLSRDEAFELLRYFIGNPPYMQDARFRSLVDQFQGTDDRPVNPDAADVRTPQAQYIDTDLAEADVDAATGQPFETADTSNDRNTAAEIAGKDQSSKK